MRNLRVGFCFFKNSESSFLKYTTHMRLESSIYRNVRKVLVLELESSFSGGIFFIFLSLDLQVVQVALYISTIEPCQKIRRQVNTSPTLL